MRDRDRRTALGLLAVVLIWHPHRVGSFSVSSSLVCASGRRQSVPVSAARSMSDDESKHVDRRSENLQQRGEAKRKRRFAQTVHPTSALTSGSYEEEDGNGAMQNGEDERKRTPAKGARRRLDKDRGDMRTSRRHGRSFESDWRQGRDRPAPPSTSRQKRSAASGGKSIEELERIMEQRWGTRLDRWTANGDELEQSGMDDKLRRQKKSARGAQGEGAIFRAKPVFDPWGDSNDPQPPGKRGRRDQHRTSRASEKNGRDLRDSGEHLGDADDDSSFVLDGRAMGDFYDEDDEGYEVTSTASLIAPKPLGGSGHALHTAPRREPPMGASQRYPRGGHDGDTGVNYLFKKPSSQQQLTGDEKRMQPQQDNPSETMGRRKQREERALPPLLDDDGNEMLLTLEQAEKNVQRYQIPAKAHDTEASVSDDDALEEHVEDADPADEASWQDIGICHSVLLQTLRDKMACPEPLSVQVKTCPPCLSGSDVLVSTHTGSGKTLAFLAPLAQRLLQQAESEKSGTSSGVKVIVVAPGRELASQIVAVARELLEGSGLKVSLAIGGTPFARNVETLRKSKPAIVVGTPGRIAELVLGQPGQKSGRLKAAAVQTIVLDECDALLEYKPHQEPTNAVVRQLKRLHGSSLQTILCSATASDLMGKDTLNYLLRPDYAHAGVDQRDVLITGPDVSTMRVSRTAIHGVVHVPHQRLALETLRRVLHTEPIPQQVLIFVNDARRVEIIVKKLADVGIIAAPLHGGSRSDKLDRAEVSKALRFGSVGIVVATEMAARGIDAPLLTHVINLDLPTDSSHYAHRAGRCGRGGRPGVVINFTTEPRQRSVPKKFAEMLGITMYTAEARVGRLRIVDEERENTDEAER